MGIKMRDNIKSVSIERKIPYARNGNRIYLSGLGKKLKLIRNQMS